MKTSYVPQDQLKEFDPEQPHALWQHLRATCPVSAVPGIKDTDPPTYLVSTWAGARQVLLDAGTFSSSINAERSGRFMGPILLAMDGEKHRSRRALISHAFRTSQLARWESTLVRPIISALCDGIAHKDRAELVEEAISRFPVQVICGMCAIPGKDSPLFLQWAKDVHRGMLDEETGRRAADGMRAYLEPLMAARRKDRGDDLISDLVHAEIAGERLTDEEVLGFLRLLLPAGSESTFRAISTALLAILSTPGLYQRVDEDRALLAVVIEETLRWDVSNSSASRVAVQDATVAGCPIPAGSAVRVVVNSANRDESQNVEADVFNVDRANRRHVAFGLGPHQCLGQPLARIEMRVGLDVMLSRLRNLRLDPSYPTPVVSGASFRSPAALNVLFEGQ